MTANGGASKRKTPDEENGDIKYVLLSIKGLDGRQLFFKVNRDRRLIKVFREYCNRLNVEYETLRFVYDGRRVTGKQTPKTLCMEDGDEILVTRPQTGGGVGVGVAALNF